MGKNKKVPEIRFKGFEGEWEEKELGSEVAEIIGGGTPNTAIPAYWDGGIDWYSPTEIGNEVYASGSDKKITELGLKKSSAKLLPAERTILFTSRAGIGDTAILKRDGTTNQGFQSLVLKKGFDTYFIYTSGHLIKRFAEKHSSGSTFLEISGKMLGRMLLSTPSAKEQSHIGIFFQNLDALISLHQRKHDKLSTVKKAMLEKMFPKEGENVPEIRFKGFTGKWNEQIISEICLISTGKSNTQDRIENGPYPFYVRSPIVERSQRYLYDEEAVLTVGDGVGTGKVFHYVNGKYDLHQRVYRIFGFKGILGKFFYYYFSCFFYDRVMSMTAKTSVDSIRLDMISDMKIKLPPDIKEQQNIVATFQHLDSLISLHQRELDKLKNIKKACLEKMFV